MILLEGNERKLILYLLEKKYIDSKSRISKELGLHKFTVSNILKKFEKYGIINNNTIDKSKIKIERNNEYLIENIQFLILGMILAIIVCLVYLNISILLGALLVYIPQTFWVIRNYLFNKDMWKIYIISQEIEQKMDNKSLNISN
ncbi:MAG: hypothetical protein ACP5G1_01580 [Nanopusillaceae archaeon]